MSEDTFLRRISKHCMSHKRGRDATESWLQRISSGEFANKKRTMPTVRDVEAAHRSEAFSLLRRIKDDERAIQRSDPNQLFDDQIDAERIRSAMFGYELSKTIETLGETATERSQEVVSNTASALNSLILHVNET